MVGRIAPRIPGAGQRDRHQGSASSAPDVPSRQQFQSTWCETVTEPGDNRHTACLLRTHQGAESLLCGQKESSGIVSTEGFLAISWDPCSILRALLHL